jgi:Silicon transporter
LPACLAAVWRFYVSYPSLTSHTPNSIRSFVIFVVQVECSQGSLVGLPPIQRELYKDSHPVTHKICSHVHKGDNLDRYLMSRQFMVLFIVFITNLSGAPLADADVLGLPSWVS